MREFKFSSILLIAPIIYYLTELAYQLLGNHSTNWYIACTNRGGLVSISSILIYLYYFSNSKHSTILSFLFIFIGMSLFSIEISFINTPLDEFLTIGMGTKIVSKITLCVIIFVSMIVLFLINKRKWLRFIGRG